MRNYHRELAEKALGDQALLLETDQKFTWKQLESDQWKIRFVAFSALGRDWDLDRDEVLSLAMSLAKNDPEPQIVAMAVDAIGKSMAGTFDSTYSNFLAAMVHDDNNSDVVRISAFEALDSIQQANTPFKDSATLHERAAEIKEKFEQIKNRSLAQIDWDLVNRFVEE